MELEGDVVGLADLAARVGDLVLWPLVLELEDAAATTGPASATGPTCTGHATAQPVAGAGGGKAHRLGSIAFPSALFLSFFMAMGPMLLRWSALGFVMMASQMTAELVALAAAAAGQSAVT